VHLVIDRPKTHRWRVSAVTRRDGAREDAEMTVAAILALKGREVVTTSADLTINDVVKVLAERKIGALVVVENSDRIVGIVSERDIVKATAGLGAAMLDSTVASIMTRNVVTCSERETLNDVMGRMTRGRFRHLPVAAGGRLTGIVSIGDVVKARLEEVQREADEMRTYIATA
jgi:CBS domain-containing protein